jgi:hypothetical protein
MLMVALLTVSSCVACNADFFNSVYKLWLWVRGCMYRTYFTYLVLSFICIRNNLHVCAASELTLLCFCVE